MTPEDIQDAIEDTESLRLLDIERHHRSSVRKSDAGFVRWFSEENPDFVRKARLRFLRDRMKEEEEHISRLIAEIEKWDGVEDWAVPFFTDKLERVAKSIRTMKVEISILSGKSTATITPDMIARAREYPITSLVEANSRGYALCVNPEHDDHTPSMWTKNNFAHCFSCGWTGDSIDVAMTVWKAKFPEAVKKLV